MSAQTASFITVEEYLEFDRKADYKSEYYNGQMWPVGGSPFGMAGGRPEHNVVGANVIGELRAALKGKCTVFTSDQRVRIALPGFYAYPDVSVACGKPVIDNNFCLLNPRVVVEVLSKTTETNDRGLKLNQYVKIESLQEYILVSLNEPRVEVYRRHNNGDWLWHEYTGLSASVLLPSLEAAIPLAEIFSGVDFPTARPPA